MYLSHRQVDSTVESLSVTFIGPSFDPAKKTHKLKDVVKALKAACLWYLSGGRTSMFSANWPSLYLSLRYRPRVLENSTLSVLAPSAPSL